MVKFWDDFSKWLEDASKVLSKEAGDLTLKGKLKWGIFELKRKLQEQYKELGKLTEEILTKEKGSPLLNETSIKNTLKKIKRFKKEIKERESLYKKIGRKERAKGGQNG